ncbi:methyltransferase domain-containing protein [Chromobacterium haemolyticum]|uniref:methyltransferase domain-containing protein n=1 Tax=Chromobacterium haemolyticum TaxID=394935 RepID=UPI0005BB6231|nr:methyltransferase domain-containing protein [Chromobacterium haemolyticum]MDH0343224.1 TPMT family class I SAM-dependent methyltransferase [Chromobacterium haemolyticum]
MAQDSSLTEFWDVRYRDGVTPWEGAQTSPEALAFFQRQPASRILLPGCGSAGDLPLLLDCGHQVLAIDFSEQAVAIARAQWPQAAAHIQQADFFAVEHEPPFDAVFERAFLCALPPRLHTRYAEHMARLLRPGGTLAGVFFIADTSRGPPFGLSMSALSALLEPAFALESGQPQEDGVPVFGGQEFWMVWRRQHGSEDL